VVFALALAFTLPLLPLFFGWFSGISGYQLFSCLGIAIVVAIIACLRLSYRTHDGQPSATKIFMGASAIAWFALSAYAVHTGMVVEQTAREVAAGAPYCQENEGRKLSNALDMTVLNMRRLKDFGFNTEFHGQLVVDRNGMLERYHWSHRAQDFHGNGRVFSQSICLREFNGNAEAELRQSENVKLTYTPREFRSPRGYARTTWMRVRDLSLYLSLFCAPALGFFLLHLFANPRRLRALFVSTVILEAGILCLVCAGGPSVCNLAGCIS
jgi:hypothetical protein